MYRMKVTAILPDSLVNEVRRISEGKNVTESLLIALKEWLAIKAVEELNGKTRNDPLEFQAGFAAESAREYNRKR